MTELDPAARRKELEDASGELRELCEDVPVPMQTKQYVICFCGSTEQSAAEKSPQRQILYAAIERFQQACAALDGDFGAAGYAPREVASIEKESARFGALRQEIAAVAGDAG